MNRIDSLFSIQAARCDSGWKSVSTLASLFCSVPSCPNLRIFLSLCVYRRLAWNGQLGRSIRCYAYRCYRVFEVGFPSFSSYFFWGDLFTHLSIPPYALTRRLWWYPSWHSHLQTTQILNSLLGILTIQVYTYYTRFKNDPLWMKCWIATAYLIDVSHQIFGSWMSYNYAVSFWVNEIVRFEW